jgi:hypothetical protein
VLGALNKLRISTPHVFLQRLHATTKLLQDVYVHALALSLPELLHLPLNAHDPGVSLAQLRLELLFLVLVLLGFGI